MIPPTAPDWFESISGVFDPFRGLYKAPKPKMYLSEVDSEPYFDLDVFFWFWWLLPSCPSFSSHSLSSWRETRSGEVMDLLKPKAGRIFSARPVMCCPNMPILLDLKICSLIRTWMYWKLPAHEELTVPVRDGKNTLFWILRDFKRPIFVSRGVFFVNLKLTF